MSGRIVALNERRRPIGSSHHNAKLDDADIDLIFALREEGLSLSKIAEKFEVGKACVYKILKGLRRAETPVEWRRAGKACAKTSPPPSKPAKLLPPGEDSPGALLQRHLNAAWR